MSALGPNLMLFYYPLNFFYFQNFPNDSKTFYTTLVLKMWRKKFKKSPKMFRCLLYHRSTWSYCMSSYFYILTVSEAILMLQRIVNWPSDVNRLFVPFSISDNKSVLRNVKMVGIWDETARGSTFLAKDFNCIICHFSGDRFRKSSKNWSTH